MDACSEALPFRRGWPADPGSAGERSIGRRDPELRRLAGGCLQTSRRRVGALVSDTSLIHRHEPVRQEHLARLRAPGGRRGCGRDDIHRGAARLGAPGDAWMPRAVRKGIIRLRGCIAGLLPRRGGAGQQGTRAERRLCIRLRRDVTRLALPGRADGRGHECRHGTRECGRHTERHGRSRRARRRTGQYLHLQPGPRNLDAREEDHRASAPRTRPACRGPAGHRLAGGGTAIPVHVREFGRGHPAG